MHGSIAFLFTCALTAAVSAIALTGTTALGPLPISLALLVSAVVLYFITGLRPVTVAFVLATMLTILVGESDAARLEVERGIDALIAAIRAFIE